MSTSGECNVVPKSHGTREAVKLTKNEASISIVRTKRPSSNMDTTTPPKKRGRPKGITFLILLTTPVTGDTRNERTCIFPNVLGNDLREKRWEKDPKYTCQVEQDINDSFDKFDWNQFEGNALSILTFMYHEKNS
ncbi:hypothetical protein NECAME_14928 [Necator americanus]|uniref:Uncharacterized protein n=1 Tax=Necator americanus TaxID=51031 RepID=W2SKX5_NECAM|nr:hypothetical protein NECAME_14928 [Necator americanus]ETN70208.1 hypothetical protein NECAME_14928 [Necator americanus]